ncbi:MAG: hypothetical protein Q9185_000230 [Variospora sp. 1 TL-2023]
MPPALRDRTPALLTVTAITDLLDGQHDRRNDPQKKGLLCAVQAWVNRRKLESRRGSNAATTKKKKPKPKPKPGDQGEKDDNGNSSDTDDSDTDDPNRSDDPNTNDPNTNDPDSNGSNTDSSNTEASIHDPLNRATDPSQPGPFDEANNGINDTGGVENGAGGDTARHNEDEFGGSNHPEEDDATMETGSREVKDKIQETVVKPFQPTVEDADDEDDIGRDSPTRGLTSEDRQARRWAQVTLKRSKRGRTEAQAEQPGQGPTEEQQARKLQLRQERHAAISQRPASLRLTADLVDDGPLRRIRAKLREVPELAKRNPQKLQLAFQFVDSLFYPGRYWELRGTMWKVIGSTGDGRSEDEDETPVDHLPLAVHTLCNNWKTTISFTLATATRSVSMMIKMWKELQCYVRWRRLLAIWRSPTWPMDIETYGVPNMDDGHQEPVPPKDTRQMEDFFRNEAARRGVELGLGSAPAIETVPRTEELLRALLAPYLGFSVPVREDGVAERVTRNRQWNNTMVRGKLVEMLTSAFSPGVLAVARYTTLISLGSAIALITPIIQAECGRWLKSLFEDVFHTLFFDPIWSGKHLAFGRLDRFLTLGSEEQLIEECERSPNGLLGLFGEHVGMDPRASLERVREKQDRALSPSDDGNDDDDSGGDQADDEFLGDTLVEGNSRRQHGLLTPQPSAKKKRSVILMTGGAEMERLAKRRASSLPPLTLTSI